MNTLKYCMKNFFVKFADSRKYTFAFLIFITATLMCVLPPTISSWLLKKEPLIILSGTEWISVVSLVGGFYFGANVWQKKISPDAIPTMPDQKTE